MEQVGVQRAKQTLQTADLILLVIDGTRPLQQEDYEVFALCPDDKTVCLLNKQDIPQKIQEPLPYQTVIPISARTGEGMEQLLTLISKRFQVGELTGKAIVTNPRHKNCLLEAKNLLEETLRSMGENAPFDILLSNVELAITALGEISGMTVSDEIIDHIFANFCVGK